MLIATVAASAAAIAIARAVSPGTPTWLQLMVLLAPVVLVAAWRDYARAQVRGRGEPLAGPEVDKAKSGD